MNQINKLLNFLSSMKFAMLLLIIFAFSIGYATFIEHDFGTASARSLIYNALWFEILLFLLCVCLIRNILNFKMFRKEKRATLVFHLSFILILIGSFVTRLTSVDGLMVIDEGSSSGQLYTSDAYFQIEVFDTVNPLCDTCQVYKNDQLLHLRGNFEDNPFFFLKYLSSNHFSISKDVLSQDFKIEYVNFLTNINDKGESQSEEMKDEMIHALIIKTISGGSTRIDTLKHFGINDAVRRSELKRQYDKSAGEDKKIYKNQLISFDKKFPNRNSAGFTLGDLTFRLWYGTKISYLDPVKENGRTEPGFSIFLQDFQLENYPGGQKAKSFASEVEVIDSDTTFPYRIYMNHTLNYKGYRFFQQSYDEADGKYTVLEVNYDWWGTNITYIAYLLMTLGMILVFFQKKTRFRSLSEKLKEVRSKSLLVIFLLTSLVSLSQDKSINNHPGHTDLESLRKSINQMGIDISGDTVINGVSIYEIFQKGSDDIEYLINYPLLNISKVKKYFPEIKDSMISYSVSYEKDIYRLNHDFKKDAENLLKGLTDSLYVQINDSEKQLLEFIKSDDLLRQIIDIYSTKYMNNVFLSLNQFQYDFQDEEKQILDKYNIYSKEWIEFRDLIEERAVNFIKSHQFESTTISDFERLLVQDNARIKPMHTMALEYIKLITQSNEGLYEKTPIEIFLGILSYPDYWQEVPLIKIKNSNIQGLFNKDIDFISYSSYRSRYAEDEKDHYSTDVSNIHVTDSVYHCVHCRYNKSINTPEKNRSKSQKAMLELDTRFYALQSLFNYRLNIMPIYYNIDARYVSKEDPNRWHTIPKKIEFGFSIRTKPEGSLKTGMQVGVNEMINKTIITGQSITINNIGITLNNPREESLNFYFDDNQLTFYYHDSLDYMKMPPDGSGKTKVFRDSIKIDDDLILITIDNKNFVIDTKNSDLIMQNVNPVLSGLTHEMPRIKRYAYLIRSKQFEKANVELELIKNYQQEYGLDYTNQNRPSLIPSNFKISLEIIYNKIDIFFWLFIFYMMIGTILLSLMIIERFKKSSMIHFFIKMSKWLVISAFIIHTSMLIVRWIIAEHAPWSNGYEAMIYVAWASVLSGLIFSKKSLFTLPASAFVAGVILLVTWMNSMNPVMDPKITTLVPVLNSFWLMIHVELIIASYAFFFLSSFLGLLSLILMMFTKENNRIKFRLLIDEFTLINEQTMNIGLFMLTIGTFIGGVWASESWGRYWAWDPKETWALISILLYAFILHMRFIPFLKGKYIFNLMSVLSVYSIIMTFWGVNLLLSGLHSYAKGESAGIPIYIWISVLVVIIIALLAKLNNKKK